MRFEIVSVTLGKTSTWYLDAPTSYQAHNTAIEKLKPSGKLQSIRPVGRSRAVTDETDD